MASLIDLVKEHSNALSDKIGRKPLIELAEQIADNSASVSDNEIVNQVTKLNFLDLNVPEVNVLLIFLLNTRINKPFLLKYLRDLSIKQLHEKGRIDIINKRGLILRYLLYVDNNILSEAIVFNDKELKERCPWLWFDCALFLNPLKAFDVVIGNFKIKNTIEDIRQLVDRLPFLKNKITKVDYIERLMIVMALLEAQGKKNEMQMLEKWIQDFQLTKMKISSLVKLYNTSYERAPVIN